MTDPTPAPPARDPVDTRLVLVDAEGHYMRDDTGHLMGVVLTHTPNANASAPIGLEVEQQCDMQHWHSVGKTTLPQYSGAWPAETTG